MNTIIIAIFIITYTGIIFTRLPGLNIDRPSAAFFGAVSLVIVSAISFNDAIAAIDYNTITLLLGMMIIISVLELDGFFTLIAQKTISYAGTSLQLLVIIIFVTGFSSAFLVNDAVVLLFTPVILKICLSGKLNPSPFIIAEIMSSNAGSVMTITGNPQNILIGTKSGLAYGHFLLLMFPIALLSMIVILFTVKIIYKKEFNNENKIIFNNDDSNYNYQSMKTSVPIFLFIILCFFLSKEINLSYSVIALGGGSLILLFGKIKPSKVIKEVDWVLLLFFASLFIVVHSLENTGVLDQFINHFQLTNKINGIISLHGLSLILSQVVSNVPFTILMIPLLQSAKSELMWLTLASSSTLAGNLTIIGAMANIIVIEIVRSHKIKIGVWEFLKVGIIVTTTTFVVSILTLSLYSFLKIIN